MLSRVADAIFWMSRYVERAENLARFMDVTHNVTLDLPPGAQQQWDALINASGDHKLFHDLYGHSTRRNVVQFLTFESQNPNSILSCIRAARENARSVREVIGSAVWEQINQFYICVREGSERPLTSPDEFFQKVKECSYLFLGIMQATFSRGEAWHFARLGRMLERADMTSRILDVKYFILLPSVNDVGTPIDDLQWSAVLRSVGGFEMYRKQHHGVTPKRVVAYLVLDKQFPRAILHCVDVADSSLHAISGSPPGTFLNLAEKRMGQLRNELAYLTVDEIVSIGLHEFLDGLQTKLNATGVAINETFIAIESTAGPTTV